MREEEKGIGLDVFCPVGKLQALRGAEGESVPKNVESLVAVDATERACCVFSLASGRNVFSKQIIF